MLFFFSLPIHVTRALFGETNMWRRFLSSWRVYKLLPSFRSYSCKIELNYNRTPPSEPNMLWINQFQLSTSGNTSGGSETLNFCPFLHNSLQEYLSVVWFRPENLKLIAGTEPKEEPCLNPESEMNWEGKLCSSVLKKRRSKMNKHKYKKRRKKYKFLRRALGK